MKKVPQRPALDDHFSWVCPNCGEELEKLTPSRRHCSAEDLCFDKVDGIWHFLTPERKACYNQFIQDYQTVRSLEGRGSSRKEFYRGLPFQDLSGKFSESWRIRSVSFQALIDKIISKAEQAQPAPLEILDLGAGNCWLSNRLAERGHLPVSVDLGTDKEDGLRAHIHYQKKFVPVRADFDRLPFTTRQFDLAIFNAAFHYSTSYEATLREAKRVLRQRGQVVIMDSPLYRDPQSGEGMVKERETHFQKHYGFPSNALPSENFLTYQRLAELSEATGLVWQLVWPSYGWRWAMRPWKAYLLRRREPAKFTLIVGEQDNS